MYSLSSSSFRMPKRDVVNKSAGKEQVNIYIYVLLLHSYYTYIYYLNAMILLLQTKLDEKDQIFVWSL